MAKDGATTRGQGRGGRGRGGNGGRGRGGAKQTATTSNTSSKAPPDAAATAETSATAEVEAPAVPAPTATSSTGKAAATPKTALKSRKTATAAGRVSTSSTIPGDSANVKKQEEIYAKDLENWVSKGNDARETAASAEKDALIEAGVLALAGLSYGVFTIDFDKDNASYVAAYLPLWSQSMDNYGE